MCSEREGELIDGLLLRNSCLMLFEVNLLNLDIYEKEFESDLLDRSRQYYKQEAQKYLSFNSVPDYLKKIEARLNEEDARAEKYFHISTKSKLRSILQKELIVNYSKRLVCDAGSGCKVMLEMNQLSDMARLYSLFSREPATLTEVRDCVEAHVKQVGASIVSDPENIKHPRVFVDKLLECKNKYDEFLIAAFKNDRQFSKILKASIEHFINFDTRASQFLSLYADELLRGQRGGVSNSSLAAPSSSSSSSASSSSSSSSALPSLNRAISEAGGSSVLSDLEVDHKLNDVLSLFRYVQDKDIFEDTYKHHLCRRLLENTSASSDLEKNMISKLKTECGHQFTSRLEGMFKDIDLSREIAAQFKEFQSLRNSQTALPPSATPACELTVSVLTTGFWPLPSQAPCILPVEAKGVTEEFQQVGNHSAQYAHPCFTISHSLHVLITCVLVFVFFCVDSII